VQHCWGSDEHEGWRKCRWKMLEGNCRLQRDDERAHGKVNRGFLQQSWRQSFTVMWSTFPRVVDIWHSTAIGHEASRPRLELASDYGASCESPENGAKFYHVATKQL